MVPPLELVPDDKGHIVFQAPGGGWACSVCGLGRAARSRLVQLQCPGIPRVVSVSHPTHRLWQNEGLTWCISCGSYSRSQVKELARECPGVPDTQWKQKALGILKKGKDPSNRAAAAAIPVQL